MTRYHADNRDACGRGLRRRVRRTARLEWQVHVCAASQQLLGHVNQNLLAQDMEGCATLDGAAAQRRRRSSQPYGEHAVGCRKAPLCTRLGPIWASAIGATETFSFSDLRSTASGALEKRWRPCSSRKTTSKDVRCTPTRWAASFFSLAACPELLLRR